MLYEILSIIPFALIIYFLLIRDMSAYKTMFITFITTFWLLFLGWNISVYELSMVSLKGVFMAGEIFTIIFAILLLFSLLKQEGKLDEIRNFFRHFSTDKNILVILVGFFLVAFIESIAGFGTPAAIAGPILVFLGIRPITAIVIALTTDSVAVAFGAFGVPILFGIGSSVPGADIALVTFYVGIIGAVLAVLTPFVLLGIYNHFDVGNWKNVFKYTKLCLVSGVSFAFAFLMTAKFLSGELVSVFAAIFGLIVTVSYLKIFVHEKKKKYHKKDHIFGAIIPYLVLVLLLVASRINFLNFGIWLKSISLKIDFLPDISFSIALYSPGFLILSVFILFLFVYKANVLEMKEVFYDSFHKGYGALLTLIFTLAFVQMLIYSQNNYLGVLGVPETIASMLSGTGDWFILISPLIGAFGAFIAGSVTVSNLIFANLQSGISVFTSYSAELILALQSAGGNAGNLIAIHNIVAAASVVGLKGVESKIIKINLIIMSGYCLIASFVGFLIYIF